jgi:excisionase family DNA binding protein
MSSLWNSLLAQADAEDLAALAGAVAAELRQQREGAGSTDTPDTAMLSPAEVAVRCGVHVETVRRAIRSGQLPAVRIGSRLRIDPSDLNSWGATSERDHATPSVQARRRPRRRQAGVLSQAMSDIYPRHMKAAS